MTCQLSDLTKDFIENAERRLTVGVPIKESIRAHFDARVRTLNEHMTRGWVDPAYGSLRLSMLVRAADTASRHFAQLRVAA